MGWREVRERERETNLVYVRPREDEEAGLEGVPIPETQDSGGPAVVQGS